MIKNYWNRLRNRLAIWEVSVHYFVILVCVGGGVWALRASASNPNDTFTTGEGFVFFIFTMFLTLVSVQQHFVEVYKEG